MLDVLRHMLGADSAEAGFRNHYCADVGGHAIRILQQMAKHDLVRAGRVINNGRAQYFHATTFGARLVGIRLEQYRVGAK